ncbi:MAG: hypothetical protein K8R52_10345, partial [Bacteroidales bacterium]|nr:hypothetical protein [Bacteroidales bacterium]
MIFFFVLSSASALSNPYSGKRLIIQDGIGLTEQLEDAGLEEEIEKLEAEKSALEEEVNGGTLDYELLNSKSIRIARLIEEIESKMERWMDLDQLS